MLLFFVVILIVAPSYGENVSPPHELVMQLHANVDVSQFAQRYGLHYIGPVTFIPGNYHRFVEQQHISRRHYPRDQVRWMRRQVPRWQHKRTSDPLFSQQWHLPVIQAPEAWDAGFTGRGVTVAIVDDGVHWRHPDMTARYLASASHDYNDGDSDPTPHMGDNHGTCCAGVTAATANNTHCGAGVAPDARIAGIRLIGGPSTDIMEAAALSHGDAHIYSNSWGPQDDGRRLAGPGRITREALAHNVRYGREGRGAIYIWAAGNGGHVGDSCAYDGYASSPYTIAVGAIDSGNRASYYSEGCAALMCVAPSSGRNTPGITTIDVNVMGQGYEPAGECTARFGGTSSACPTVAGVIALALQANPRLTWRDVQLLIAKTSAVVDERGGAYATNSRGYRHSERYGFGVVQARVLVETARTWQNVPQQRGFGSGVLSVHLPVPTDGTSVCVQHTFAGSHITFVEHVLVRTSIRHPHRGRLRIRLRSPERIVSTLSSVHPDTTANIPSSWLFTSVRHFGESAVDGPWQLCVQSNDVNVGTLESWQLAVFGH